MELRRIPSRCVHAARRISLFVIVTAMGCTTAFSDTEVPKQYLYQMCGHVTHLLYNLTGDRNADRRELGASVSGRPETWNKVFDDRIAALMSLDKTPPKAIARAGIIEDVLEVYLSTDKTKEECRQKGCLATLYYNNGDGNFSEEKVEIDASSFFFVQLPAASNIESSDSGTNHRGTAKEVVLNGKSETITLAQSPVDLWCPAVEPGAVDCDISRTYVPQTDMPKDTSFRPVIANKSKRAPEISIRNCDIFRRPAFSDDWTATHFARGDGIIYFVTSGPIGDARRLIFATDIKAEDLWLTRDGSNLIFTILGSDDSVEMTGWFDEPSTTINVIHSGDGKKLDRSKVQSLVDAMRPFKPASASYPSGIQPGALPPESVVKARASAWQPLP